MSYKLIISTILSLIAGSILATQMIALWYMHAPELGRTWYFGLYAPWDGLRWWYWWRNTDRVLDILVAVPFTFSLMLLFLSVTRSGSKKTDLERAPEWGSVSDLINAGLVSRGYPGKLGGIILGETENGRLITFNNTRHVIVSGPIGSGKTAVNVVPTILSYSGSLIILDPKAKLFEITGEYRQSIGDALFWDPSNIDTCSFNPFGEVDPKSDTAIAEVQRIVGIKVGGSRAGDEKVKHWRDQSESLISAMALFLLHSGEGQCTFAGIRRLRLTGEAGIKRMLSSYVEYVRDAAKAFAGYPQGTQQAILSGVDNVLLEFGDPAVAAATASTSFRISDLMCSDKPMALYIQCRANDDERLAPLMSLIITQVVSSLTSDVSRASDGRGKKHTCLLVLEESAFGRYEKIMKSLLIMREYGLHALIITQSMAALRATYGRTAIDGVCAVKIGSASNDREEQEYFCGDAGQRVETLTRINKKRYGFLTARDESISLSQHKSPLMTYQQFRGLAADRAVMVVEGIEKAFLIFKRPWFESPVFKVLGRNVRAGDEPSVQSGRFISKGSSNVVEYHAMHGGRPDGGDSKLETSLARLARLKGWHAEQVQREFFGGEVALSTVKQWMSGSKKNIPVERMRRINKELALIEKSACDAAI